MGYFRASRRFGLFLFAVIRFIVTYTGTSLVKGRDQERALKLRQSLCQKYTPRLGIEVIQQGEPPQLTAIYISNHRSYIDPVIPLRDIIAMPVAKAEIHGWPLIGFGIEMSGVLFVKREHKESRRNTRKAMAEAIRNGRSILIYPEGTTDIKPTTLEFHKGTFATAAAEGIPIVPMAIEFADKSHAWIGNEKFLPHFFRTFTKKRITIAIRYGQPIVSDSMEELLTQSQQWIDASLLELQEVLRV